MKSKSDPFSGFGERDFYLAEFRGRTLAIALRTAAPEGLKALSEVLDLLAENATRVVLLSPSEALIASLAEGAPLRSRDSRWPGHLWRALQARGRAGLVLADGPDFARECHELALRLGFAKLVFIDDLLVDETLVQRASSYVDRATLAEWIAKGNLPDERLALLREIYAMIDGGIPAVNVCRLDGLAEELFTYAGSGTLFTRDGYTVVRALGVHDFDAAHHLMLRGVEEGFLVERSPEQQEEVLANAFGVFIEDRYLAGVGALLPHATPRPVGEVASLYTVTRFVGEGVGRHLLRFACQQAREESMEYVFACTTSATVERFFIRYGFEPVGPETIPESRWKGYPEARRASLRCVRHGLQEAGGGL